MHTTSARLGGGNGKAVVFGVHTKHNNTTQWVVISVVTSHEFSLVAIGVGALVGLTMVAARPTSAGIAVVAALLTVVGCALGEFLGIPAYVARNGRGSFSRVLGME